MKLKALLVALFVAGLTASFALAGDGGNGNGNGKAKNDTDTATTTKAHPAKPCKPRIELQLAGTVTSTSDDSIVVLVSRGHAQGAKLEGDTLTLDVSKAKVDGDLAANAKVKAHARACVDLVQRAVTITATHVNVSAAS